MKFEALGREGNIGSLSIKNRMVLPALNNNFTHNGYMTEESIDFYVGLDLLLWRLHLWIIRAAVLY